MQNANHHMGGSGGLPLEVLYEDPKEDLQSDVLSILSSTEINDDDKKKLIEEIRESSGNNTSTDQTNPKPNINMRLNTKSIFSRFTSSNNANGLNNDDFFNESNAKTENCAQKKTEDEIILESSWLKLNEEIRDVHLLIDEFYHSVSF